MMIILLYSAAILRETILLINYLRLRLVEVRLPEPCSSLVKHQTYFMVTLTTNLSNVSDIYFKDQLTVYFSSIKQKHDYQNTPVWFTSLKLTD